MRRCAFPFLASLLTLTVHAGGAQAAEGAAALMQGGSVDLSFRYRYEFVDDDAFAQDAQASTLRSRLAFQSGAYRDLAFLLEIDDVREIILDDFDAGAGNTPGRSEFPAVADPQGTEVNQAYVDYRGLSNTTLRLGRQRINLDNQRFVGGVGWRQNEQTYDAVSVDYEGRRAGVFYALVENVNRVFGEDVPAGDHDQDLTHLLNLSLAAGDVAELSGYHYVIDNADVPAFSTRTTGARLAGGRELVELTAGYLVEYARQSDAGNNPASYDADYWHLNGSATVGGFTAGLGWEVLGGDANDAGEAFRTPLATLHAFNGWADQFLVTPDAGLDDRYVTTAFAAGPWNFELRGHLFEAEDGGTDYGREIDLRVGRSFAPDLRLDLFAAAFDGSNGMRDVSKIWVMVTAAL